MGESLRPNRFSALGAADKDAQNLRALWQRGIEVSSALLEPQHVALAATASECALRIPTDVSRDESDPIGSGRILLKHLASSGLCTYAVPSHAGSDATRVDLRAICIIRERLAGISGLADAVFALQGLGSYPVARFGSQAARAQYLPGVSNGTLVPAFALTEQNAGSDAAALQTVARRDGDDYVLDGEKTFISNAGFADFYVVFARTGTDDRDRAKLSAFIVPSDTPGLSVPQLTPIVAPHILGDVRFERCRVPASLRIGEEGEGLAIAMATLDVFRPSVAAAALGFATRALAESIAHTNSRTQFKQPISRFQGVSFMLADMTTEIEAARLLVYNAARLNDTGAPRSTLESSIAKYFSTEMAQRVVDHAVQLHGGTGVVRGSIPERLYREVRALRIYEGTSEIQKLVIAREMSKRVASAP